MFYQLVEKEVLEIMIRVLVDVFRAESKRAKQTRLVRSDVNAQPAPSPKFSAVYHRKFLYTVACTPHGVQLGPPCCPRRIPFVFYRVQQARCFVHIHIYIYIFALCHEFPTYSSKVFYDMLVGITWLPGKLRSFERATLNSGNTAEQFSSAIDDLLPLPYFSKIFRIYRGENVQHAPSLSFSLPTTFLFLQPLEFDRQRRSGKTISFLPEGRFFFPLISFFFLIYFYKVILDKGGGRFN